MNKLILAIDLGASLTKCIYGYWGDSSPREIGYKTFCSAVQRITSTRYEWRQFADDNTSLVSFDHGYWAVGENARDEVTNTNVRASKYRTAIAKVLAIVGQVMTEQCQEKAEVEIELGVLLPLHEMGNAIELSHQLGKLLYGFGFNGTQVECALVNKVHISPEGYGICRMANQSPSGVMMFGHKDFTWVHVEEQSISIADSRALPGWGMLKLIRQIPYTFHDELRAAAALCAAGEGLADKPLLKVIPPEDLVRVKAEIPEARELVWAQLWDELASTTIRSTVQVFAAGGNGPFWRPELKKTLRGRLSMGGELIREMAEQFSALEKSPLLYRMADCYGFFKSLIAGLIAPAPALKERRKGG